MVLQGDKQMAETKVKHEVENIPTPADLKIPFLRVKDHGLTMVHDMAGAERNWLHEVSVADHDAQVINYLVDAGYREHYGWRSKDGQQWWTWCKEFPVGIAG
jgi:hypothetical protein